MTEERKIKWQNIRIYPGEDWEISEGAFIIVEFDGIILAAEISSGEICGFVDRSHEG